MNVQRRRCGFLICPALCVVSCALIFACGPIAKAATVTAEKFFALPKTAAARSAAGGVYPHGDQIALGLYAISGRSKSDPSITNMARAAQAGFNLAGPYYGLNWQDFGLIYAAHDQGMQFTFQIRPEKSLQGLHVDDRPAAIKNLTDAAIAASVREQVSAVINDPIANQTVSRWTLGTEELRHWKKDEMRYLKVASEAIRDAESALGVAHRPMWMYEPNHRTASELKKTGKYQDVTSKGIYLTNIARGPQRSGTAIWGYEQIASAAKSLKTTPQAVLQLSQDFPDPLTANNPDEIRRVLRHDMYLGLVMGMKGFNIWSMSENRPNLTTFNEQFAGYASVAEDLTGDLNLQDVFLYGEPRRDLKIKITSGAKSISFKNPNGNKSKVDSLHYLNTAFGSDRYLFLVNSLETPMDVNISGLPSSFLMDDIFAGTTTAMTQTSFNHRLDVLGVAAFRFHQFVEPPVLRLAGAGAMSMSMTSAVPEPSSVILVLGSAFWLATIRPRRRS
jgi:hypothetical protein